MLLFPDTKVMQSIERAVAVGSTITAEGQALVTTTSGGVFGVSASTGTSADVAAFAGVSLAQQLTMLFSPALDNLVVNTGLAVTTTYTPYTGTLRVVNLTRDPTLALLAGAAAGNYGISGNTITVVTGGATVAGDTLAVYYRYTPTTLEALAIQGNIPPGGAASLTLGSVGVITQGDILTSEYDTTVDWTAANVVIKTGANGVFTIGGSGATVNGFVTAVPSSTSPYLGIHLTA